MIRYDNCITDIAWKRKDSSVIDIAEEIQVEKLPYIELLSREYPGKRILFFDIETTGFTPDRSIVYLIGLAFRLENGNWQIHQLFNDDGMSEPEVLRAFYDLLPDFDLLMHFNGDRFDTPFLEGRLVRLQAQASEPSAPPRHLTEMPSADLLKMIRPLKKALGLPNVRQKTVERYLGVNRVDEMDGGQLISVYWSFITSGSEREKALLLQHNRDDMEGMLLLSGIFGILQLLHPAKLAGLSVTEHSSGLRFHIETSLTLPLPHPVEAVGRTGSLSGEDRSLRLNVPVFAGELSYFFGLKTDGCEQCSGYFIPLPSIKGSLDNKKPAALTRLAVYKKSFSDRQEYIALSDSFLRDEEAVLSYAGWLAEETLK